MVITLAIISRDMSTSRSHILMYQIFLKMNAILIKKVDSRISTSAGSSVPLEMYTIIHVSIIARNHGNEKNMKQFVSLN